MAQGTASSDSAASYEGVTLSGNASPPRAPAAGDSGRVWVTWPGMDVRSGAGSRFFVQVSGGVRTETHVEEGRVVIMLRNARVHLSNNRNPLESRFFNTPVSRAFLERRGRNVAFVMELRANVQPQVEVREAGNGYRFVVASFAAGNFVEQPAVTAPAAAPANSGGALPSNMQELDNERPPALRRR